MKLGKKWSSVKLCGRCHQSSLIGATARLFHWPKCKSVCRAALMPLILFLWLLCYRWKWRTVGQQCIPPAVGIIWLCTARARLICLLFFFFIPFLFVFSFRTKQITHTDGRTDFIIFRFSFFCFGHSPLLFVAWSTLLAPHFVAMVPKSTNANGSILRFVWKSLAFISPVCLWL